MSNANRNMTGTAVHAFDRHGWECVWATCGKPVRHATTVRPHVTCRRCLATLAKRDRALQRKARGWFRVPPRTAARRVAIRDAGRVHAARAIAAEESPNGTPLGAMQRWEAITASAARRAVTAEEGR